MIRSKSKLLFDEYRVFLAEIIHAVKIECIGAQKVIIKSNAEERKPKVLTGNIFQFAFAAFVL
jgi:hypothetical protein